MSRAVYEHIADTYLGNNNKRSVSRKKSAAKTKQKKWPILFTVINVTVLITVFFLARQALYHNKVKNTQAAVYLLSERYPIRLSYDLTSSNAGAELFSFSFGPTSAATHKYLKLRIKVDKFFGVSDVIRIELENQRRERDFYYIKGTSSRWQEFSIELSQFKNITNWSKITSVSFMLEDWNIASKRGIIYIDNIRFSE